MNIEDLTDEPAQASMRDVSFDELLDDTIGLSFKSLRSIWLLFKNPVTYFIAAKAPFWQNSFSPSFRIYAGLVAISSGMKFLYRDENSPMVQIYKQQFETVKAQLIESGKLEGPEIAAFDTSALAIGTLKWYFLIAPLAMFVAYTILGLIYFGWGEKLNPVVRIRYVFAVMIPASVVGFLVILPTYYAPPQITGLLSLIGMTLMFGMIWVTSYRGAFNAVPTKGGRAGRATALSALAIIFMFISAFFAVIVGVILAMKTMVG